MEKPEHVIRWLNIQEAQKKKLEENSVKIYIKNRKRDAAKC